MKRQLFYFKGLFVSLYKNFWLIIELIKRDVVGRYKNSGAGILWSLFNPVLSLLVYTYVFSMIFKLRWPSTNSSKVDIALLIFAGMIIFNFMSESLARAPTIILNNPNFVKKIKFPLEVYAFIITGSSGFHLVVNISVWLIFYLISNGNLHLSIIYFPIILVPLWLYTIGFFWFLSSLGVYLRDTGHILAITINILQFLTPIFYPVDIVPDGYRYIVYLNPITFIVEQARNILFFGNGPPLFWLFINIGVSLLVAIVGFAFFEKTKKGFADVI